MVVPGQGNQVSWGSCGQGSRVMDMKDSLPCPCGYCQEKGEGQLWLGGGVTWLGQPWAGALIKGALPPSPGTCLVTFGVLVMGQPPVSHMCLCQVPRGGRYLQMSGVPEFECAGGVHCLELACNGWLGFCFLCDIGHGKGADGCVATTFGEAIRHGHQCDVKVPWGLYVDKMK